MPQREVSCAPVNGLSGAAYIAGKGETSHFSLHGTISHFFILEALHLRQDIEKPRHLLSVFFFFYSLNLKEFCVEKQ